MKKTAFILLILALVISPALHAQKGKNKGGGNGKGGGNKKGDIHIDINIGSNKGNKGNDHQDDHGKPNNPWKGDHNNDGHPDNGWHNGHSKGNHKYGNNTILWVFGPGDIYNCKGKDKKERIKIYDGVCLRLSTNIGFMFGLLGDIRIQLDGKKAKLGPERYKKIKVEIDLLDEELKIIEFKKQKIKIRLAKLNKEKE
jgi:hypothetical protein